MEDAKAAPVSQLNARDDLLRRVQTAESVFLPREVFEALYLTPRRAVPGDLRRKFGNPTPAALIGFVISATPFAAVFMGWRGAGGQGGALIPTMIFFGGLLQLFAAIGEWILGNTFPMCLFFTYGTFWLATGSQLIPWFGVGVHYSSTGDNLQGMTEPSYFATVAFFYLALAMLTTIFTICALRTNIVFFSALFMLIFAFSCAAGAFWNLALGKIELAHKLTIATGALVWALTMMIWYLLAVQLLESVDFPLTLPVGDLSTYIKGKTERAAKREEGDGEI